MMASEGFTPISVPQAFGAAWGLTIDNGGRIFSALGSDGGQIVLNIAETIKGSAFSTRTRERILKGGLLIIGLLFVTVMFNDISRNMQNIVRLVGRIFGG